LIHRNAAFAEHSTVPLYGVPSYLFKGPDWLRGGLGEVSPFPHLPRAASSHIFMRRYRRKQIMPDKVLCPKCHGQRTSACLACNGTGKRMIAGITIGNCKKCDGVGQRRCDVCGGSGEVEPPPPTAPIPSSAVNEHQPSCFGLEEERGERWKGSGATKPAINEVNSSL
jgi:transcription elongation factor Elf1